MPHDKKHWKTVKKDMIQWKYVEIEEESMKINRKETEISDFREWTRKYFYGQSNEKSRLPCMPKVGYIRAEKNDYGKDRCPMSLENYWMGRQGTPWWSGMERCPMWIDTPHSDGRCNVQWKQPRMGRMSAPLKKVQDGKCLVQSSK